VPYSKVIKELPLRAQLLFLKRDLQKKMVFIGGPRQVGKTTLAQSFLENFIEGDPGYYNWDLSEHRKLIREKNWPRSQKLIILDEIHKNRQWRNLVKGVYDTQKNTHQFMITGSARLNTLRRGGDSLMGRYYYHRLHPFGLPDFKHDSKYLEPLFKFGGFPEPLLEQSEIELGRWHLQRLDKLVYEDLRDIENVKELNKIELLAEALQERVGSPLSFTSLAEDLETNFHSIKRWIQILDSLYYCYLLPPYGAPKIRAVKKEQKLYLWDWSQVDELGHRFENMVAGHLLRYCHHIQDTQGKKMELRYIRDTDKREIDFVVLQNKKPLFAVEAKLSDRAISKHIKYFMDRTPIPHFYQVHMGKKESQINDQITLLNFISFSKEVLNI